MKPKKKYAERFVASTPKKSKELDDRQRKVLEIFSRYQFDRILDIGCGDGNYSVLLKKACNAKEVYGIEISEKGVKLARENGVKAFRINIDGSKLPFEDNYFDGVFAGEIIEHLYDTDNFVNEVYRTLKPGGIFVMTTPNLAWWVNRVCLLFGFQPYGMNVSSNFSIGHVYEPKNEFSSFDHIRFFTLKSLQEFLKLHNFQIINIIGVHIRLSGLPLLTSIVNVIDRLLSFRPSLSNCMLLVLKKK